MISQTFQLISSGAVFRAGFGREIGCAGAIHLASVVKHAETCPRKGKFR